jgi:hypothetical protein
MTENLITDEVLEFFKAMANVERIKIIGLIANENLTVAEIAARQNMKPINTQHHIEQLVASGLVSASEGIYSLDKDKIINLSRNVLQGSRPRPKADDFVGEESEFLLRDDRKVLMDFFSAEGTLKSIPVQNKKRLVILRRLAEAFDPGSKYPEKEVNEILRRYHADTASLRRYLVDEGLLAREHGVYWRV